MSKEDLELLDSMVESLLQDVEYQFDLDKTHQAIKLVRTSIDRLEKNNA